MVDRMDCEMMEILLLLGSDARSLVISRNYSEG
jgi:hypothetical protein